MFITNLQQRIHVFPSFSVGLKGNCFHASIPAIRRAGFPASPRLTSALMEALIVSRRQQIASPRFSAKIAKVPGQAADTHPEAVVSEMQTGEPDERVSRAGCSGKKMREEISRKTTSANTGRMIKLKMHCRGRGARGAGATVSSRSHKFVMRCTNPDIRPFPGAGA